MPQIVTINESVIRGAAPNLLQQKGVLVSLGATTIPTGTVSLLAQASDLTSLLASSSGGTASSTGGSSTSGSGSTSGGTASSSGGTASSGTSSSTSTNTTAISELKSMVASWFANSSAGVWVLELGNTQDISDGLGAFITSNALSYYGYVLPRGSLKTDSDLVTWLGNQGGNNARVYFFLCGGKDDASSLTANPTKSVFYGAEASGATQSQEHLASAVCAQFLSARPGPVNRLAPMSFRYLVGITAWQEAGNGPSFASMKSSNIGFPGTSREGGVEGTILFWGNFLNGDPMSEWYGADWAAINLELQLANLLIEDSQPGIRPLVYDQNGVDRITARAEQTLGGGEAAGCLVTYTVTYTPFAEYIGQNPSAYTAGEYSGIAATIATPRGFISLTFNLAVDFSGQTVAAAAQSTTSTGA